MIYIDGVRRDFNRLIRNLSNYFSACFVKRLYAVYSERKEISGGAL